MVTDSHLTTAYAVLIQNVKDTLTFRHNFCFAYIIFIHSYIGLRCVMRCLSVCPSIRL